MGPLGRRAARSVAGSFLAVALLASSGALVRALPWLVEPRISMATVWVFARGLLAAGIEVSGLVAMPLGFALAAAAMSDRGEARACFLCGASPSSLVRATWPLLLLGALITGGSSAYLAKEATAPSAVLTALLEAARAGCDANTRPVAEIPGTSASWLCPDERPPQIAIAIETSALVRGSAIALGEDLRGAALSDARLDLRGPPLVHLSVDRATLRGLTGLAAPSGLSPRLRALASALGSGLAAFAVSSALLSRTEARRLVAALLASATSVAMLLALRLAEAAHQGILAVASLAAIACLPLLFRAGALPWWGRGDRPH